MSEFDEGGRPVGEEDVIARVERYGLAVEADGRLEIPVLTGLVRLAHLVQEAGLAGRRQLRVGIHLHLFQIKEKKKIGITMEMYNCITSRPRKKKRMDFYNTTGNGREKR